MKLLQQIRMAIKEPTLFVDFIKRKTKEKLLWNYYYNSLRNPKFKSKIPNNYKIQKYIITDLKNRGFRLVNLKIDIKDYKKYVRQAKYQDFPYYYNVVIRNNFFEKTLEHYVTAKLLSLSNKDVYIDVANADAPTVEIYSRLYGCKSYRQDLLYQKGIKGNVIGGDAGNMSVKDGFATKMALHCCFEHFEGNSDINFIKETNRVLQSGGKLCIAPLYLFKKYAIQTDPATLQKKGIPFESDAVLYCAKGFGQQHSRHYDAAHLMERIKKNLKNLKLTIYVVNNEKEIDKSCYVKFVALFEKK